MLLYVAGPYSGDIDRNIEQARRIGIKLWESGHVAFVPHLNSAHFEIDCACIYEDYMRGDLMILERCDGIVMTPDWATSRGATMEYHHALERGLPVWVYPNVPPPTDD